MPTLHALLVMALYVSLVLITPGPTNTLLLSSGLKAGFRDSWHLVLVSVFGYGVAISLWGFFLAAFAATQPWLYDVVKAVSSVYILYLAGTLWKSARPQTPSGLIGWRAMFMATLINPKSPLFACAIFPPPAFNSLPYWGLTMAVFAVLAVLFGSAWMGLGSVLTSKPSWAVRSAMVLRAASVALVFFSGTLMFSVLEHY